MKPNDLVVSNFSKYSGKVLSIDKNNNKVKLEFNLYPKVEPKIIGWYNIKDWKLRDKKQISQ